jgi:hypothetical protein
VSAKAVLGAFGMVLVLCVWSAGAAGAAEWRVNGVAVGAGGEPLAEATGVKAAPEFVVPGVGVTIKCTGLKLQMAKITPLNTGSGKLTFGGCATTIPATGCSLESPTITGEVVNLSAAAVVGVETSEDLVTLTPVNMAKVVEVISFSEANKCAFAGLAPVKGKMVLNMPKGQEEKNPQEIVANTGAGELTVAGNEVQLKMTVEAKVNANKPWSYR